MIKNANNPDIASASNSNEVVVGDPPIDRKSLTFEQAEGRVPLPTQLGPKTISQETRALLWYFVHASIAYEEDYQRPRSQYPIADPWHTIMLREWILRQHRPVDEFNDQFVLQQAVIKQRIMSGDYVQVFGFLQFVLRNDKLPEGLAANIAMALERTRSAYRLVDGDTVVPLSAPEDIAAIERAFADVAAVEFAGARSHLRLASEAATAGQWAQCVTQSMHAVEATAKSLVPYSKELRPALDALKSTGQIHGALMQGFLRIYDFTSDEKGLRHSLSDVAEANVDETDALFMLGACASFVSYLIRKGRAAGLFEPKTPRE